jgi:hypothetical protein
MTITAFLLNGEVGVKGCHDELDDGDAGVSKSIVEGDEGDWGSVMNERRGRGCIVVWRPLFIYQKCTAQKTQARKIRSTTGHCWKTSRNQKTSQNGYLTPMTSYRSWHLDLEGQRDGVQT